MKNTIFTLIVIFLSILVSGCNSKIKESESLETFVSPETLYNNAMINFDSQLYEDSTVILDEIISNYPLSNEAVQSKIMLAFIEYIKLNYNESIYKFNRIIKEYPSHKNIDYAYYMKAICYYEQIENETLDGNNNLQALENFNQIINRFPNSKYARDSEQKVIFVKENIAAKHMSIALFYLKQKKYPAAMKRYQIVINQFSKSKFTPEALHRLVEIYYNLGLVDDAERTAAVISYNYPKSKWYAYSYNLIKPESKTKRNTLIYKLTNFLKNEDE